jgi:hypothetical protein
MKRYLCVLLMLAWALSSAPALAAEAPSFSDVPEGCWARESRALSSTNWSISRMPPPCFPRSGP